MYNETDDATIRNELKELRELVDTSKDAKRRLILAAAEKLAEKYKADTSVVAGKLQTLIAKDRVKKNRHTGEVLGMDYALVSKGYVYNLLPKAYKREYAEKDTSDAEPINLFEECLTHMASISKNMTTVLNDLIRDLPAMRDTEEYARIQTDFTEITKHENVQSVIEHLRKQMSTIRHLGDFAEILKTIDAEVASVKNLLDKRQKYSTAVKILLRMAFYYRSYDHIAKTLSGKKYGGKWLAAVQSDSELNRLISKIQCPCCNFSFESWLEQAKENERRGLEMPAITEQFCRIYKESEPLNTN